MRIPFDLREYINRSSSSFDIDFSFTDEEKKYLTNLSSMDDCLIHVDVINSNSIFNLTLTSSADVYLIDSHNGEVVKYELDDNVDITINLNDDNDSDILPDNDGIYDLRPCVLALLYNAIPKNYSTIPLKRIDGDCYTIMSQDEYESSKSDNPFSNLDYSDIE